MYSFTAILVLIVIVRTGVDAIIMGKRVDIREAPFAVMIYDRSNPNVESAIICGGTIISNRHVLTAAHCFTNNATHIKQKHLVVIAGENSYYFGARTYEIGIVYIHSNFTTNVINNVIHLADIAVIELVNEIHFGPTRQPIKMADREPASNSTGTIFGWGAKNSSTHTNSRTLQRTVMQVFPFESCEEATPELPFAEDELCIIGSSGRRFCDGDSGGPLIVNGEMAGILSRGQNCQGRVTAINVARYKLSIEDILRRHWNSRDT